MYTRKQRWRRTRTRKQAWGDLPPELLDAMLAAGGGGMPKSVSWDHSYAAGLKIRADRAAEVAHRAAAEDSKLKAAAAAAAAAKGKGVEVSIPRSVSCSSLGPKRTLFARTSSSKDELGAAGGGVRRGSSATTAAQHRRRMLPHRRGVSFNTQVKMVLIPKREEFSELERVKLWWGREDYSQFRQVLIDWKRANAHRISHSDNILSINLSDIDEEEESATGQDHSPAAAAAAAAGSRYTRDHEEAAAAAEATAQAAAAAKAAAEAAAAAATTRAATAQATAAAAAAATAAEVAALNAEEMERERRRQALAPPPPPQQQQQQLEDVVQQAAAGQGNESGGADAWEVEVAVAKAMAAAVAAAGGGIAGGAVPELSAAAAAVAAAADGDGDGLEDVPEGTDEGQKEEARIGKEVVGGGGGKKRRPCARASFSVGGSGLAGGGGPDWSPNGGANGTFPLRRALTFGEVGGGHGPCSPADSGGGRLREVPLSEAQAMAESLRAWRQSFDVRNAFFGESGDGDAEEDRGRAVSLQVQSRSFARRGRATALVTSRTKWTSDVVGGGEGSSGVEAKGLGLELGGRSGGEEGSGAMAGGGGAASDGSSSSGGGCVDRGQRQDGVGEKTHRTLSDQEWSSSRRIVEMAASEAASLTNPVMAAFERERKEAAARQAEVEDAQAARAAAMVKQAAAAAKAGNGEVAPAAAAAASAAGTAEDDGELHVGSVVRLGLNDAPGSAAAASAAGLRIAAEGVSNLSLRSRDSVENLQERGEQSWGPLPLSSSA